MSLFKIFVEGKDDKRFIEDFLLHIGISSKIVQIEVIGGWTKLKKAEDEFLKNTFLGGTNLIIFDADLIFDERQGKILAEIKRLKLTTKLFLLPNNRDLGNLDSLLIDISNPTNRPVLECFDGYNACLRNSNADYKLCNNKEKIYAYFSALNNEAVIENRNYRNENLWNLNHVLLADLKAFLLENLPTN